MAEKTRLKKTTKTASTKEATPSKVSDPIEDADQGSKTVVPVEDRTEAEELALKDTQVLAAHKKIHEDPEEFTAADDIIVDEDVEEEPTVKPLTKEETILFYTKKPKDFGGASLWFLFAYVLIGIPLVFAAEFIVNVLAETFVGEDGKSAFDSWDFSQEAFLAGGVIAFVAIALAVAGLLTVKKTGYPIWKPIVGLVGTLALLATAWFVFV